MFRYAATIFISAFLLFQVQPLIGKYILPWFGGSPAVWTTCMLFFQVVLLAGYSYAHWLTTFLRPRAQAICHLLLLTASLWFLPIAPNSEFWKSASEGLPIGRILGLLVTTIGLPYFLLSSTGPLLQESFRRETGRTPYRLYSLSNIGSLLALLSYPFVFEPQLTLRVQVLSWSAGYVVFVVLCGICALMFTRALVLSSAELGDAALAAAPRPQRRDILLWLALAACGSVMLLATTNQLCQEITSVPFLWVIPLAIYLFTFIICFDHERWYHRNTFLLLLTIAVLLACYVIYEGSGMPMWRQLAAYCATLFVCCMVCHGELVRSKPAPRYATLFYLMVSAGGALGGILVAIVAPLLLRDFWEYHMGLFATVVLAFSATMTPRHAADGAPAKQPAWAVTSAIVVALAFAIGWAISSQTIRDSDETNLETARNFYGVLHVNLLDTPLDENGPRRELIHGRIEHGCQYLDAEKRRQPTTYYGPTSGVGMAIQRHPKRQTSDPLTRPLRIGVVGLGCGTLAAYGEKGDYIRFYEINPEVLRLSDAYFTYRKDTPAEVEVRIGDARIRMEQEKAAHDLGKFDVLAIDAFSSDAIPMHLLTKESVELFLDHLAPDGMLCVHISNRFLDLSGVVLGIAQAVDWPCVFIDADRNPAEGIDASTWAILTKNQTFLDDAVVSAASTETNTAPLLWTDDYGSLWHALNGPSESVADETDSEPAEEPLESAPRHPGET